MSGTRRTAYGGHMGAILSVIAAEGAPELTCFTCGDESLYHDAYAYWHEENDDLLCPDCFQEKERPKDYLRVVTYH